MPKYVVNAQAPIGQTTVQADRFEISGALVVFWRAITQSEEVQTFALPLDKVFTITEQQD